MAGISISFCFEAESNSVCGWTLRLLFICSSTHMGVISTPWLLGALLLWTSLVCMCFISLGHRLGCGVVGSDVDSTFSLRPTRLEQWWLPPLCPYLGVEGWGLSLAACPDRVGLCVHPNPQEAQGGPGMRGLPQPGAQSSA